jgi:hypothetical protein
VSEPDSLEVEFDLQPEDLLALQRFQGEENEGHFGWESLWWLPLVLAVGAAHFFGKEAPRVMVAGMAFLFGAVVGGWARRLLSWYPRAGPSSVELPHLDPRDSWEYEQQRVTIGPDGVKWAHPRRTVFWRWTAFWKIGVTNSHLFFFESSDTALIVPRRAFSDDGGYERFVVLVRRYHRDVLSALVPEQPPPRIETTSTIKDERFDDRRSPRH